MNNAIYLEEIARLNERVEALESMQLAMQSRMLKIAELCQKLATASRDNSELIRMLAAHVGATVDSEIKL